MKSQIATSSDDYGGRRYLPYVFTEAGIAMLSAVLRSDVAIEVSIRIMNAFVEMRHFLVNNAALVERIAVELKQLEYQNQTDEKFNKVFAYIDNHAEDSQKLFFDGQIYDAFLNHISLLYYYGLLNALRETKLDERFSAQDVLKLTKNIYLVNTGSSAENQVSAIQKKALEILQTLKVDLLR